MTIAEKLSADNCCPKKRLRQYHRHHIDPTLKSRDPVRYAQFLENDIMICTPYQHSYLHKIYDNYSYDEYLDTLYALSATNLETFNICFAGTQFEP